MWVIKIRDSWLVLSSLLKSWCWVPSPQSNNHSSARWGNLRATLETLRDRVGTPELVPKNVICTAFFSLPLPQFDGLFSIVARLLNFQALGKKVLTSGKEDSQISPGFSMLAAFYLASAVTYLHRLSTGRCRPLRDSSMKTLSELLDPAPHDSLCLEKHLDPCTNWSDN